MLKNKKIKIAGVLAGVGFIMLAFSGCAMLPYSSNYSCPEAKSDMGNCSSLVTNYKASLHPALYAKLENQKKAKINCPVSLRHTAACESYGNNTKTASANSANNIVLKPQGFISMRKALYRYMFQAQTPPLRIPSVVKKALVLPYSSKSMFHGFTNIYFITRKGKWLMGNYLYSKYHTNNDMHFKIVK